MNTQREINYQMKKKMHLLRCIDGDVGPITYCKAERHTKMMRATRFTSGVTCQRCIVEAQKYGVVFERDNRNADGGQ